MFIWSKTFFFLDLSFFSIHSPAVATLLDFVTKIWQVTSSENQSLAFFSPDKNHFCIWTGYQQNRNETHIGSNLEKDELHYSKALKMPLYLDTPFFLNFYKYHAGREKIILFSGCCHWEEIVVSLHPHEKWV